MQQLKNEQQLIEQAKTGNQQAFETLILQYERLVFNITYRMLQNPEDTKDISQEIFIKVYKNLAKFDGKSSFSTWIYRIAVNACIDEIRRQKGKTAYSLEEETETQEMTAKKQFADTSPSPEQAYLDEEGKNTILTAMKHLSEEHKTVLILRDLQGFSYTEIAEITNTSMGTVKSRLARARNQLKNLLQGELSEKSARQIKQKGGSQHEL